VSWHRRLPARSFRFPLLFILAAGPLLAVSGPQGIISGSIRGETGGVIPGAIVSAYRISSLPPLVFHVAAGAGGSFSIKNLPAGTYRLCAQAPGSDFLDPCRWSSSQTEINLVNGQVSTGTVLSLKKGSVVKVRINDAGGVLDQKASKPPHISAGVWTAKSLFCPATLTAHDASGRNFEVVIPQDAPYRFSLSAVNVQIQDEVNALVGPAGFSTTIQPNPGGGAQKTLTFTVVGPGK